MFFFSRFTKQVDPIRRWMLQHQAKMSLDFATFMLTLESGGRSVTLHPRFAGEHAGRTAYFDYFSGESSFVGWLPYRLRRWELATDKIEFKRIASARGLRVPAGWRGGSPLADNYIVKPARGSFGLGMRGPFGPLYPYDNPNPLGQPEFFEQFIVGSSAKAWFWNSTLVALEVLTPPKLYGDGVRTLRQLAEDKRGNFDLKLALEPSADIFRWQGLTADSVAEKGREVLLDFRYATPYDRVTLKNRDVLSQVSQSVRRQFEVAGRILHNEIDAEVRDNTAFTVDAVIDAEDRVWFLEMNSHPMIHPAVYGPMLESLFEGVALESAGARA
ncbi:hypothetical protein [Paraburkholderia ferrariae]|uniref:ATP-grasp domain-containing protein n=1 Tax=Paraburkholderia ferrariae TaxID=386056 RepID=A0ABU9RN45_9BURK